MQLYIPLLILVIGLVFMLPPMPGKLPALGTIMVWLGLGFVLAQVVGAVPLHFPR